MKTHIYVFHLQLCYFFWSSLWWFSNAPLPDHNIRFFCDCLAALAGWIYNNLVLITCLRIWRSLCLACLLLVSYVVTINMLLFVDWPACPKIFAFFSSYLEMLNYVWDFYVREVFIIPSKQSILVLYNWFKWFHASFKEKNAEITVIAISLWKASL